MKITCEDRERVFLDGSPEQWAALELHAASCASCAEELRAWKALSLAAEELRDYQESPALWSRIETALVEQDAKSKNHRALLERLSFWRNMPVSWQAAIAGAVVLVLALTAGYVYVHRDSTGTEVNNRLLRDRALADVERTERDYIKAIDKLASDAKPQLDAQASPLMASYREKLIVLDSTIEELRSQAGQNPSNAHLRYQLLAIYQDKQETLQEILETKR